MLPIPVLMWNIARADYIFTNKNYYQKLIICHFFSILENEITITHFYFCCHRRGRLYQIVCARHINLCRMQERFCQHFFHQDCQIFSVCFHKFIDVIKIIIIKKLVYCQFSIVVAKKSKPSALFSIMVIIIYY